MIDLTKPYKLLIENKKLLETPDIIDLKHGKIMTMEGGTYNISEVKFIPEIEVAPSFSQRLI